MYKICKLPLSSLFSSSPQHIPWAAAGGAGWLRKMHSNVVLEDAVGRVPDEKQVTPVQVIFSFNGHRYFNADMSLTHHRGQIRRLQILVFVYKTRSFSPALKLMDMGTGQAVVCQVDHCYLSLATTGTKNMRRTDKSKSVPAPPPMAMTQFISWHFSFSKEGVPCLPF